MRYMMNTAQGKNKILMVSVEPTPYILGLINALTDTWLGKIDIIFLKENFSQEWALSLGKQEVALSKNLFKTIKIIYQSICKENYAVIFIAGWSHPVTLTFMFLAKLYGIPTVIDSDTFLSRYTASWKLAIKRIVYPILFKVPTLFLPAGKRQEKYLHHYNVPSKKIILEQMTVDVASIKKTIQKFPHDAREEMRKQFSFSSDDFIFIFIGRLIERKGIQEILSAFCRIQNDHAKLLIAGDGPLRHVVEEAAHANQNIQYVGRICPTKVIEVYFISDVLLLPAYFEPWGLVVNEAMAAGRPVIVSDQVGCLDDLVVSGKTGLIVEHRSTASLLSAMLYLLNNPLDYVAMSEAASQHIDSWTLENEARNICSAYNVAMSL